MMSLIRSLFVGVLAAVLGVAAAAAPARTIPGSSAPVAVSVDSGWDIWSASSRAGERNGPPESYR